MFRYSFASLGNDDAFNESSLFGLMELMLSVLEVLLHLAVHERLGNQSSLGVDLIPR